MKTRHLVASAVAALLAAPPLGHANPPAPKPAYDAEKCYGVNIRGRNDCAAPGVHGCASESQVTDDPKSWIYVPAGTCAKIQGGTTSPR